MYKKVVSIWHFMIKNKHYGVQLFFHFYLKCTGGYGCNDGDRDGDCTGSGGVWRSSGCWRMRVKDVGHHQHHQKHQLKCQCLKNEMFVKISNPLGVVVFKLIFFFLLCCLFFTSYLLCLWFVREVTKINTSNLYLCLIVVIFFTVSFTFFINFHTYLYVSYSIHQFTTFLLTTGLLCSSISRQISILKLAVVVVLAWKWGTRLTTACWGERNGGVVMAVMYDGVAMRWLWPRGGDGVGVRERGSM